MGIRRAGALETGAQYRLGVCFRLERLYPEPDGPKD